MRDVGGRHRWGRFDEAVRRGRRALALLLALGLLALPAAARPAQDDEDDDQRVKIPTWRLERIAVEGGDLRGAKPEEMKSVVEGEVSSLVGTEPGADAGEEARAARAREEVEACKRVFEQYSFEQVEHMIKEVGLSDGGKQTLAEARRQMIREAMAEVRGKLRHADPEGKLKVGMLDSGNKGSGIASDIDQTVFVFPRDLAESMGITVEDVIKMFDAEFNRLHGMDPMRLGIESMNGWDFFPDWRAQTHMTSHETEARRVVREKRLNPEAYRSEGQLKSQAEGRGWDSLDEWGRNVEAFDNKLAELMAEESRLRTSGDQAGADRVLQDVERVRAEYEAEARLSPWTEVALDAEGKPVVRTDADPRGKVLPNRPEMAERFSFDGAYDNWIMYEHHPHNRPKYLLRSGAEGVGVKRTSVHNADPNRRIVAFDYDVEYGNGNRDLCDRFVDEIYQHIRSSGGGEGLSREKIRKAFDAAAKFRLKHKGKPQGNGRPYRVEDVWSEYLPERPAGWYDDPQEGRYRKTLDVQTAQARWDLVGREIMIENMMLTVTDPLKVVTGDLSSPEWQAIKRQYPNANIEIWRRTAWLQLYHGVHDLLSDQHVRQLVGAEDPGTPRRKDIVDRLLATVTDPAMKAELERAVLDAAKAKFALDPRIGLEKTIPMAVWEVVRTGVVGRVEGTKAYAKSVHDEYKAGRYTPEVVASKVVTGMASRMGGAGAEVLDSLGFRGRIHLLMPDADHKLPALEIEFGKPAFSGKKLMSNMLSAGNLDSALVILEAALDNPGDVKAVAWVAAREVFMNVPYVAPGYAVYDLVVNGRPEGAVMMGSALFIPGAGHAFIAVNIATTSVRIAGKLLLDPLRDDKKDQIYQGFLGAENAFRRDQGGKRVSLLDAVQIRVIPFTKEGPDGAVLRTAEGHPQTFFAVGPYSDDEAWDLELVDSTEQLAFARELGLLGGGPDWDEHLPRARDEIRDENLRFRFEAQRYSLFLNYWPRVSAFLDARGLTDYSMDDLVVLEGHDGTQRILLEFFRPLVDQWVTGTGEFANRGIGAENEVLVDTVAPPDRVAEREAFLNGLAARMVSDFFEGWQLVRGTEAEYDAAGKLVSVGSLESSMRLEIESRWADHMKYLARQGGVALEDARAAAPLPELAAAHHGVIKARAPTEPAPRIHVRPRILASPASAEGGDEDVVIDFLVSVVCDPDPETGHPPPYRFEVEWGDIPAEPEEGVDRVELVATKVTVFDANGKEVGFVEDVDIGTLAKDGEWAEPERLEQAFAVAPELSGVDGVEVADAHDQVDLDAEPLFTYDDLWLFVTPDQPAGQAWDWALIGDDEEVVAWGHPTTIPAPDDEAPGEPSESAAGEGAPGLYAFRFGVEDTESGVYRFVTRPHWRPPDLFGLGGPEEPYPWEDSGHTVELKEAKLHFNGFVSEPVNGATIEPRNALNARVTADPPRVNGTSVTWSARAMWDDLEYDKDPGTGEWVEVAGERRTAASALTLEFPAELELWYDFDVEEMGKVAYDLSVVDGTGGVGFLGGVWDLVPSATRPPSRYLSGEGENRGDRGGPLFRIDNLDLPPGLDTFEQMSAEAGNFLRTEVSGTLRVGRPDHRETGVPKRELGWHLRDPDTIYVVPVYFLFMGSKVFGYGIYGAEPGVYDGPAPTDGPGGGGAGATAGGDGAGGDGTGPGGHPLDPAAVDPNHPDISALIREWLAVAEPPENATIGANLRYTEWGVKVGTVPGGVITANAPPDAAAGWTSVEYCWMLRDDLDSVDHCKLGEYVMSRIGGPVLVCAGRYGPQPPTPLSDYRGRPMGRARGDALEKGLVVDPVGGDPAPEKALEYRVQDQWPAPDTDMDVGDRVELKVYGAHVALATVPDLSGLSLGDVRARLGSAGLQAEVVGGDPAPDDASAYTVQWQDPAGGAEVTADSPVTVALYGAPPALVVIPSVLFETTADARAALEGAGLEASFVGGDPAPWPDAAYTVADMDPPAGLEVPPGTAIELVVFGAFVPEPAADPTPSPTPPVTVPDPAPDLEPEPPETPAPPVTTQPAPVTPATPAAPPASGPAHEPFWVGGFLQLPTLPDDADLPEGVKPSQHLRGRGHHSVSWERSEDSPLLLRIEGQATGFYPPDMFAPGSKVSMPVRFKGSNPQTGEAADVSGALLIEVTHRTTSLAALAQAFPDKAEELQDPHRSVFHFSQADGRMQQRMQDDQSSFDVWAGPMERGWSDAMKAQAFEFFIGILEMLDCFVATAVYERSTSPELATLRRFRDEVLLATPGGARLVDAYYALGPRWAARVRSSPGARRLLEPALDRLVAGLESADWDHPAARALVADTAARLSPWLPPRRLAPRLLHDFDPFDVDAPLSLGGLLRSPGPADGVRP